MVLVLASLVDALVLVYDPVLVLAFLVV